MNFEKYTTLGISLLLAACGGSAAKDPATAAASSDTSDTSNSATETTSAPLESEGEQLGDLEYKRMQANINGKTPEMQKRFKELCGYDVAVDIDWKSFGRGKATLEMLWSNYGVERLVTSFESVCHDQVGKDSAKAKVKTLKAVNTRDKEKIKVTVSGGTMTALLNWSSGGAPGMNESEIGAAITKQL